MEFFIEAIERSEGGTSKEGEEKKGGNISVADASPSVSFDLRPPQWCTLDKWFTTTLHCFDENIKELEAVVFDAEGHIVKDFSDLVSEDKFTTDKNGSRNLVTVNPQTHKATFRMKFTNGSRGAWLLIGFVNPFQSEKCLLKSPPIKVQSNRIKRPREARKSSIPSVSSLSPNEVPSSGNFPGRKDRMLLIFGSNFDLWGNSPVVRLRSVQSNTYMEIRPPDLIWWSENLLECQFPECAQDIEVRVANYDLNYGEGKILNIVPVESSQDSEKSDSSLRSMSRQQISNSDLSLDYVPMEGIEDSGLEFLVKVVLQVRTVSEFITAETSAGSDKIHMQDIGLVIRIWNKTTNKLLKEVNVTKEGQRFCRNPDTLTLTCKVMLERSLSPSESVFMMANLRKESTSQYLLDPMTKVNITAQKIITVPEEPENDVMQIENETPKAPINSASKSQQLSELLRGCEVNVVKSNFIRLINGTDDLTELDKWEHMLTDSLHQLRVHRSTLDRKRPSLTTSREIERVPKEEDEEDDEALPDVEEDGKEKTIAVPQMNLDPNLKQTLVYWKFFNPGTRTFLELSSGKLQIIGSRRIQMLIESIPPNSKFINASLYVQKNDGYEMIENCVRCKENGIPNVFCVLPRRGREHDFPWITFRITCTSTAKHWKGSPFWIGAEYLLDPTAGTIIKVFSPPIHVQSKVKSKDLAEKAQSKYNLKMSQEAVKPSPNPSSSVGLDGLYALTQQQHNQLQQSV
eukprot:TRINITY_DN410_c0_g1_i1.p1 TRINITY_DN410_c0_g1~~TRINITY_DN410_c0_g1_i1.p1  ORF type:complete len:808 (+),score=164.21 TRINITY_DN410_c0_g1_i1:196-2424(+)